MSDHTITILISTLTILLFIGLVVLLLVLNNDRRNRHRAEVAEMRARQAEEVRRAEREVLTQALTEVGRDLHDNIGQLLTVIRLSVNQLIAADPDNMRLADVKANLDTTFTEVRRASRELNHDDWEDRSLAQAIEQACARVARTGMNINVVAAGHEPVLSADQKLILFRIFQESLNNALKHAQADRIEVRLADGDGVRLSIADNGKGFQPSSTKTSRSGQGLLNMQRRAAVIGYHCDVHSSPGNGTTVSVSPE